MKEAVELLNDLKFFGIKESLMSRIGEAESASLSYQEFLAYILEDERLYRRNCRYERLRKRAKFRASCYLENFECSPSRGVGKSSIQNFKSLQFIRNKENMVFLGGTGVGKSFLAQAIGHEACAVGIEVFFISANRLFKELEIADTQGSYLTYMNKLRKRVELLIIDDFGLRNYTHPEANILYEILEERYKYGSLILTSQIRPQGWASLFEDPVIAESILDRLTASACKIRPQLAGHSGRNWPGIPAVTGQAFRP